MARVEEQVQADASPAGRAETPPLPYAPVSATAPLSAPATARARGLASDLIALAVIGVLLIAALGAGGVMVYQKLYSAEAFASRYLELLGQGRAADALALPGVSVDSATLEGSGLPAGASEALLRSAALAPLNDIRVVRVDEQDGVSQVTLSYAAGPHRGATTLLVEPNGRIGIAPAWRFAQSPLALIDLTLQGSRQFRVNGFELDIRQVAREGAEFDPMASVPLLVFAPGLYSVSIDTPTATSSGVAVLADSAQARTAVSIVAEPTPGFLEVVNTQVNDFLAACATQQVLQPTGCPFGRVVRNRIVDAPTWSIVTPPVVTVQPHGVDWAIPRTEAVAHIEVDIMSLFDGSIRHVDEDVPFAFTGTIQILSDGTAAIEIAAAD